MKDNESGNETEAREFEELLGACLEIAALFPQGVVYIGGIAVYLHAINYEETKSLAEFTHDADFYISLADMADLRDIEEVTSNRRLNKHQLRKRGFEFDIYTERHSALLVPYDQIVAYSEKYDELRVASLEHLIVLKLEAYRDRAGSSKGEKDAKDLIRLALIANGKKKAINGEIIRAYLNENHFSLLKRINQGSAFLSLARGNAKLAKNFRQRFEKISNTISGPADG